MEPSEYQKDIYEFVKQGRGNLVVQATAGSGKTTVLVELSKMISTNSVLFVAFNKHIVSELEKRLPINYKVKTSHSIGYKALFGWKHKKYNIVNNKYWKICCEKAKDILGSSPSKDQPTVFSLASQLEKVSNFSRMNLINPKNMTAVMEMIKEFNLEVSEYQTVLNFLPYIIEEGNMQAEYAAKIDFTDMLYLPMHYDLPITQYEFVLADEIQDFNECQVRLLSKCLGNGGRFIGVGDPNQGIYSFAGAGSESIQKITEAMEAKELPLSICYRCPRSHIKLAKKIVPTIESAPDAEDGVIEKVNKKELALHIREGDLVLCRTTAPLVSLCIELIAYRIPARVKGRDVGKQLTAVVEEISQVYPWERFGTGLEAYHSNQQLKLQQRDNNEQALEALADRVSSIQVCYEMFKASSYQSMTAEIEAIFSDERSSVWLSTVHRAKGLESDRVFILKPEKLPFIWKNQSAKELAQEFNVKFVALTRAKKELYFVVEE